MGEKFIPLSVPNIKGNELEYVVKAIETEWVSTAGSGIEQFEKNFADYLSVKKACAVQSGTAGLHLCMRHFGIQSGDIVLVPTMTFIATVNPVIYQNAEPIFFDCDEYLGIDTNQVREYLENECIIKNGKTIDKVSSKIVKAIVPVHLFGDCADMDSIMELAEKYNLIVIEDATESLGSKFSSGKYKGMFAGTVGHAGVFSFNGNKIITTGGGGMIIANDENALEHMKYLSQQAKDDGVYFVNNEVGYNYRMTNIQAVMGVGQLEQLDEFIKIKRENYHLYCELLKDKEGISILPFKVEDDANFWFYSLNIENGTAEIRDKFIDYMTKNSVQTRPIWKLNHTQKPFLNFRSMTCERAEKIYNKIVNLPCSSNLSKDDVKRVCDLIMKFDFGGAL